MSDSRVSKGGLKVDVVHNPESRNEGSEAVCFWSISHFGNSGRKMDGSLPIRDQSMLDTLHRRPRHCGDALLRVRRDNEPIGSIEDLQSFIVQRDISPQGDD